MTIAQNGSPILEKARATRADGMDHVHILESGDDALLARIHLIRSARRTIHLQTFIWKNDDVGIRVLKELYDAALRGVKVRVLVDFYLMPSQHVIFSYLNVNHPNFQVRYYNPPEAKLKPNMIEFLGVTLLNFMRLNQRMHNKVFCVDGAVAIIGGRNYDNTYYDRGQTRNFIDTDCLVTGPAVKTIFRSFTEFWRHKLSINSLAFKDVQSDSLRGCAEAAARAAEGIDRGLFTVLDREADDLELMRAKFAEGGHRITNAEFVYDPPGKVPDESHGRQNVTAYRLQALIGRAEHSLYVQSPYFVLSRRGMSLIKRVRAAKPGLDIVVSTNSLAATDNIYAYAFLHKEKKFYIKDLKVRMFELKPVPAVMPRLIREELLGPAPIGRGEEEMTVLKRMSRATRAGKHMCIHSKTFVIDENIVWVGTFNTDVRSETSNTEMALIMKDKALAVRMKNRVETLIKPENSWTVAPKKRIPFLTEINDFLTGVSWRLPVIDPWPFRNTSCFELKEGKGEVPIFDPRFYDHYRPVGNFPLVHGSNALKGIKIRLLQWFGQVMKPLV